MADVKPNEYVDELQDLSDEDPEIDDYTEMQRKQYEEALRMASAALKVAGAAMDPLAALKDLAEKAAEVVSLAESGDFEKAEDALKAVQKMVQSILKSHAMQDMATAKEGDDEASSDHPSWAR